MYASLQIRRQYACFGKLNTALAEAGTGAKNVSHRLFITDRNSRLPFLIDTGANVSVIPKRRGMKVAPTSFQLYAANNTKIPTYGEKTMVLDLKLRRPYSWKFVIAAVSKPIIGADFLKHHNLLVDIGGRCLIDKVTNLSVKTSVAYSTEPTVRSIDDNQHFHQILAEYPDIIRPSSSKNTPKHRVEHHIETTGPPLHCRTRPLPPHRYLAVKKEFETMMQHGLCRPSKSPWSSPLHVVPKKNGDLRVCGDYRRLNAVTLPDRYPVPRLKDFTYLLHGKKIFTTLDLNRAYQQLPVYGPDIEKTAITTPFGLFEFPRMCPGLKNAGQTFQRFIHQVLNGLDFAFPFIDDVILASEDIDQHYKDLRAVLHRLDEYGITINPSKCVFGKESVKFLGYDVSNEGIKPPCEKVKVIVDYPKPETIQDLRRFLGMVNFYRDNIPNAAHMQAPLNMFLHNSKKRDKSKINWTDEAMQAFEACKVSIQNAVLLAHPSPSTDHPVSLMCDASDKCAGAVLQQRVNNKWIPIGYFSKKFSDTQQRYSTFDRELSAVYMAVKHFRKMFEGRELIIYTDHKPLIYAIHKPPSDSETQRRARQLLFISEFTTDLRHVSGVNNVVADALSRIEAIDTPSPIDYTKLAAAQERDPVIPQLMEQSNIALKKIALPTTGNYIYCETSTRNIRPYLPIDFRRIAFNTVHNISHPGIRTTRKLMQGRYFWPSMNADIGVWAKTCTECQQSKIQRHTHSKITLFPPSDRFQHLHIDIVGPLPASAHGHRYLLTMIDRATRWPEAIPIQDITSEAVANTVYDTWITRFGTPITITTDQGRQFESQLFLELTRLIGAEKTRTTAYHPQSNGIIERWHRSLKAALMSRLATSNKWTAELPTVLMGLRAATRTDTNTSAAQLTYGQALRLPGDFVAPSPKPTKMDSNYVDQLHHLITRLTPTYLPHGNKNNIFVHQDLSTCKAVFLRVDSVRKPLQRPYQGPYPVLAKNDKYFTLKLPSRTVNVSIDRLKPAYTLNTEEQCISQGIDPVPVAKLVQKQVVTTCDKRTHITRSGRAVKEPVRFA